LSLNNSHQFRNAKYVINDLSEITNHPFNTSVAGVFAGVDKIIANDKGVLLVAFVAPTEDLDAIANDYCGCMKVLGIDVPPSLPWKMPESG